jgi:hypothetical protein
VSADLGLPGREGGRRPIEGSVVAAAAWPQSAALVKGTLRCLGTVSLPAQPLGPVVRCWPLAWPRNRVVVPGDLGEVASSPAFRMLLERCWDLRKGKFHMAFGTHAGWKGLRARVILD